MNRICVSGEDSAKMPDLELGIGRVSWSRQRCELGLDLTQIRIVGFRVRAYHVRFEFEAYHVRFEFEDRILNFILFFINY